jgi:uncharacterized repeat protein (TIGR02543 family)
MYLEVRFLAQALDGRYSYNPTLYEHEWPLWDAGSRSNVFDYSYVLTDDADDIYFKADNTTYALPSSVFSMKQLDLKQGGVTVTPYSSTSFTITFTNSSFSQANGIVTVHQPVGQDITEGYMTVYWNGGPLSFTSVPISRTYHVVWDDLADRYMISFNSQGGSLVSAIIGAYQSPVTTLPQPTRAGYSFGGWYGNEACSGQAYTATTMPAMNVQLYAKWTANAHTPYTVRHYLQTVAGSAYELAAAGTQTLTGTTDTGVTPAVNTYVGFTAPEAQTVAINGDGSTVVEYYYARNSYQLTFKPRNGDPDVVRTLAYGGEISAPQVTRAGYVFDAWYSDKDPNDVYTFTTMPAEQLTLQAGWIPTSARMEISTELSSGVDGTALVGGYVHDTITLTWEGPSGDGPTGSIKVTMRTPGGRIWVVCNQVITAPTSPFSFTTTDQGLSELGLYQFKAEYIPDADSVFAGAVSDFEAVTTVEGTVTISTLLSTGVDATVTSPAWVDDTITLTWPQSGFVPTGSIKVTCKMPGGETYVVCDQVITATTSPFSFTTEEQGLGTGEMWEGGLLGPGLYQFQAEYIPDAGSLFAGAVSAYEDEQVTVLVPPVFAWEEISETGTAVADPDGGEYGFYDDFTFGPFPVGFSFPFYGNTFDSFYVSTNGWISFTEPTSFFNRPTPLPNLDAPFNLVAPFWDDLSVYTGGQNIYYLYDGEKLIVEYKNVHRYGDIGASYTFEVFLYPDGNMVFQYQSMTGPRDWATVGVQNETGNEGLQIASSEDYVEDGLAVRVCPFAGVYTWADNLGRGGN